ncbi:threonine--tRNA ligase [Candidatus Pacearchaeota archaeon]|nr:threonine--tRNA ligase [Candidatus Pacearchaeota archaeon]
MRLITLHCDYIKFKPLKKALAKAEDLKDKEQKEVKDCLVVLTAVEQGDNDSILKQYLAAVKKTAEEVKARKIVLYPYAHLSSMLAPPDTALEWMVSAQHTLQKEGYEVTRAPFGYYKEFELKCKGHPLSELSKEFRVAEATPNAKPAMKPGKEKKIILDRRNLKPNDHRILGEDLGIFYLSDEIGPGLPLWLPNGETIRHELIEFMREVEEKHGYKYVSTPHITKGTIYEKTGHLPYYAESMYPPIQIEGVNYYLKPMNCPHHHMIFNKIVKSYRDLPLRLAEPGMTYRQELSGVTYGLIRVRAFTQNDSHIYCTPVQLKEEFLKVINLFEEVYKKVGIKDYWFRLSLPDFAGKPDKFTGDPKEWMHACDEIRKAMSASGKKFTEEVGEAAFYGPKIDVQIKNSQGKEETIATSQVDIVIPKRLEMHYIDEKGEKQYPIIIHRAILGSFERFVAYLLEQTSGVLPVWLSPVQVRIINFTDRNVKAAEKVAEHLRKELPKTRIDTDFRNTTVSDKVRDAEVQKVPYIIVIGDKEEEKGTLAVRSRGKKPEFGIKPTEFIKELQRKIELRE